MNAITHPWITAAAAAYLLGSIPFGYLLVRAFRHQDIRSTGSGNIGATNVLRSGSKALGIATLLLDCLKGVVAVLLASAIARHIVSPYLATTGTRAFSFHLACCAALFATLGHIFPVWLGLRGGKGVATALGVFVVLSPRSVACALVVFFVVVALTRYVSLASMLAAATLPLAFLLFVPSRAPWPTAAFFGIPLLVIAKHNANIRRLLAGTESRFGRANTPRKAVA